MDEQLRRVNEQQNQPLPVQTAGGSQVQPSCQRPALCPLSLSPLLPCHLRALSECPAGLCFRLCLQPTSWLTGSPLLLRLTSGSPAPQRTDPEKQTHSGRRIISHTHGRWIIESRHHVESQHARYYERQHASIRRSAAAGGNERATAHTLLVARARRSQSQPQSKWKETKKNRIAGRTGGWRAKIVAPLAGRRGGGRDAGGSDRQWRRREEVAQQQSGCER